MTSKYKARKTAVDGIVFDSKKEAERYIHLRLLERAGYIKDLRLQVSFPLIPSQKGEYRNERPCVYIADFVYVDESGNTVVEDCKGKKLPEYIIKRKLMLMINKISIKET